MSHHYDYCFYCNAKHMSHVACNLEVKEKYQASLARDKLVTARFDRMCKYEAVEEVYAASEALLDVLKFPGGAPKNTLAKAIERVQACVNLTRLV